MQNRADSKKKLGQHNRFMLLAFLCFFTFFTVAQNYELPAIRWENRQLVSTADSLGNIIPDYSFCGYKASNEKIPQVPVKVVVPAQKADATEAIQKAIDYMASLPVLENGFRGTILLQEGEYNVSGRFLVEASGIVLRGSGKNTILRATGVDRETLIRVAGSNDLQVSNSRLITSEYVPVGSKTIQVDDVANFKTGMQVVVHRPSTQEWIDKLKMNEFGGETSWLGWKPGRRDLTWERTIEKIDGNTLVLNAPITTALDKKYGGATVSTMQWPGRIENIGIENLTLESEFDKNNLKDENHCWFAITIESAKNAWVRQVNFRYFAGSAVALYETASKITVEDCISTHPVSEVAGQRRNTFFTMGQQTLFLRCYAENGMHDFATGFAAAGPNAFVQCKSVLPNSFSGAIDSWASGVLFDIVKVDGHALSFKNRGQDGQGAGWTAASSMMWQCSASKIECFAPPTAQNWAYGAWAQFAGNGLWYEANSHIRPRSLFFAQLAKRLNKDLKDFQNEIIPFEGESTSSPTIEQAEAFTKNAVNSPIQLKDYIEQAAERNPISTKAENSLLVAEIQSEKGEEVRENKSIELVNGNLIFNGEHIVGSRFSVPWWRGDARPYAALKASPAITRYVPGRIGLGYTDNLQEVVEAMEQTGTIAIDHNYGLWYDRRRDDHERVRRFNAEVWAPFYEQPFSRSGVGEAWDRLSKYDLTKPNPWYWNRLRKFSELAEEKGKMLIHQNYFQHNILEAGAHWADSPWRPANNINNTGFPEPAPYAGDKRIYLTEQFYDITHPIRKELHRNYIRQCLENFKGQSNVIQCISAEYTGPLHFVEFWLDVIAEWENETGENALVALSTTKDVQDAILADKKRSKIVDIIDIRYWAYRPDGSAYAPPGGANLAPRQHARKVKTGKRSFESVYRAVAEYRTKFPEKAVIYSEGHYTGYGWAVFMGGGSLPVLSSLVHEGLLQAASTMLPFKTDEEQTFGLKDDQNGIIIFSKNKKSISADLSGLQGKYEVLFINPSNGKLIEKGQNILGNQINTISLPAQGDIITWIKKK
ncbi:DUF6298 domain-containing protein [uncultured Draconibacterium sp.]|uniref:DUF6298 domain-containing protein n=1 Tax=uncultured Draconibacterium sp. TaxID=1573823 RepID=UPI0025F19C1F|nr:DUF6298 domain-containing protein [uncultured Draconibacterium sp.]